MKAISLFSGIGGFELGFERAGIQTVLQVEKDPYCLKILEHYWPDIRKLDDVKLVGTHYPFNSCPPECKEGCIRQPECVGIQEIFDEWENIDLIYGGFPCQDLSVAGKREGLRGERSGLWFEFYRILSELRPRWAVIENVPGLLSNNRGQDFNIILQGLDELGYSISWAILDAQYFGVPQHRRRVFIVAGPSRRSTEQVLSICESCEGNFAKNKEPKENFTAFATEGIREFNYQGGKDITYIPRIIRQAISSKWSTGYSGPSGDEHHNLVVIDGKVRRLTPLECERLQGFPDNWTNISWEDHYTRTHKLRKSPKIVRMSDTNRYKQIGNAVCVPVVEWIGHRLVAVNDLLESSN